MTYVGWCTVRDYAYVDCGRRTLVDAAAPGPGRVSLEAGALGGDEKVIGCALAKAAGAAFVKTSTGSGPGGATAEDVALMRQGVGEDFRGKASGGVRTPADARRMLEAGANSLGARASGAIGSHAKGR